MKKQIGIGMMVVLAGMVSACGTQTKAESNVFGAVAESWIRDPEGNRVDISEHGWPGAGDSHA